MFMKENSPRATEWLTDVFLIVLGQQWRSMAQKNNSSKKNSMLLLVFSWDLL